MLVVVAAICVALVVVVNYITILCIIKRYINVTQIYPRVKWMKNKWEKMKENTIYYSFASVIVTN